MKLRLHPTGTPPDTTHKDRQHFDVKLGVTWLATVTFTEYMDRLNVVAGYLYAEQRLDVLKAVKALGRLPENELDCNALYTLVRQ